MLNTTQVIKRYFNICEISTVQKRNARKNGLEGYRTVIFIHFNQENVYQVCIYQICIYQIHLIYLSTYQMCNLMSNIV